MPQCGACGRTVTTKFQPQLRALPRPGANKTHGTIPRRHVGFASFVHGLCIIDASRSCCARISQLCARSFCHQSRTARGKMPPPPKQKRWRGSHRAPSTAARPSGPAAQANRPATRRFSGPS
eukprot:gene22451-biopygen14779